MRTEITLTKEEHQKRVITECKRNFYECATHFFKENDLLQILEVLQKIENPDKATCQTIDGLKNLWFRHHIHLIDLNDLTKIK